MRTDEPTPTEPTPTVGDPTPSTPPSSPPSPTPSEATATPTMTSCGSIQLPDVCAHTSPSVVDFTGVCAVLIVVMLTAILAAQLRRD